jgi:hypothetical protein
MFAVQYESRRAVAVRRMEAGTEITPDDIKIESYTTDRLEKEDCFCPMECWPNGPSKPAPRGADLG